MLYLILVFRMDYQPRTSLYISGLIGFVVTVGMAFFLGMRCIILLIIPQLFSGKLA